ncbi:DUF2510 domain-containing protein [Streptomyces sp. M19]
MRHCRVAVRHNCGTLTSPLHTAAHRTGAAQHSTAEQIRDIKDHEFPYLRISGRQLLPGFYPDPSIPNYIRYWNGAAWVPGTSRPAPARASPCPRRRPASSTRR